MLVGLTRRALLAGACAMASPSPSCEAKDKAEPKTVYLVRHAQSDQNIATKRLEAGEMSALGDIIRIGFDSPVSAEGQKQLDDAARRLDGFAKQNGIELIAHSPYQRAAATANAIFSSSDVPTMVLPALHERTLSEYVFPALLDRRIRQVRDWLDARPERVIALVGHGQWNMRATQRQSVQPNVSILKTSYSSASGFVPEEGFAFDGFSDPKRGKKPVLS